MSCLLQTKMITVHLFHRHFVKDEPTAVLMQARGAILLQSFELSKIADSIFNVVFNFNHVMKMYAYHLLFYSNVNHRKVMN